MRATFIVRRARSLRSRRPRIVASAVAATLLWVGLATVVPLPAQFAGTAAPRQKPILQSKVHVLNAALAQRGWGTTLDTGLPTEAVGFEWAGRTAGTVEVRARRADAWGPWMAVSANPVEGPDPGSRESHQTTGAGPVWVGHDVERVEVRVADGELQNLRLHAIRSERAPGGEALQPAAATVNAPPIISRAAWGADESFRTINPGCGTPEYASSVRFAIVHHTDTGNDYSQADSAAVVRSIYYFHTHTNGWCDIGYNLLVDRYGQVFEGRAGGVTQAVIGAHAANFNTGSTGVSLIGSFMTASVPGPMYASLRSVLAWKMSIHGINPRGQVTVNGRVIPTLIGHRDVNPTDCPGDMAYVLLGQLRDQVAADIQAVAGPPRVAVINGCGAGYVKEGPLNGPFHQQVTCGDARVVALAGYRVGVINGCGAAYVKEGALSGPFNSLLACGDARALALTPERVGVINGCSAAYVEEGSLGSPFIQQLNCGDAGAISMAGTGLSRVGAINSCGAGYVKEGPLNGPFVQQVTCGDARAVVVSSNRIGVINGCGAAYVKEGALNTPFNQQTACGDTRAIAVTNDRIAVINGCGSLYVKEGALNTPFNQQTACNDAAATALAGDRVGVINGCGAAYVKEGPLGNPFNQQVTCGDARSLSLSAP